GSGGSGGSGGGPTNLIPDGNFEGGKGAWGSFGFTTAAAVSTTLTHGGVQSLKAGTASVNAAITRDILPVVAPGKKYTATAYAYVVDPSATPGPLKFQTALGCNSRPTVYPVVQWVSTATVNSWTTLTGTIDLTVCPVDLNASPPTFEPLTTLQKLVLQVGKDVGDLYVDDASLVLQP
ncbi:MAG TPA: carbohydrate binding domain-containing protein, partial [Polyangiaceae bacterium]|nr:carbohydrate binding domain-containing protein [Polyangiaceae bacterium]